MVSLLRGAKKLRLHVLSCDPDQRLGGCHHVSSTAGEADRVQQVSPALQLLRGSLDHRMQVCLTSDSTGSFHRREKQRCLLPKLAFFRLKPALKTAPSFLGMGGPDFSGPSHEQAFACLPACCHLWIWAK